MHLSRSAGIMGTARWKGDAGNRGRPGMVGESQIPNVMVRMADHLGVGKGQRYLRSRVTPVEGRTLTSGVLVKEGRSGDWR